MYTDYRGQVYDNQGNPHGGTYSADVFDGLHQQDLKDREARFKQVLSDCSRRSQNAPRHGSVGHGAAPAKKGSLGKAIFWGVVLWVMLLWALPGAETENAPSHPARPAAAVMQSR